MFFILVLIRHTPVHWWELWITSNRLPKHWTAKVPASSGVWDHGGNVLDFNSVEPPFSWVSEPLGKIWPISVKGGNRYGSSRWFAYSICGAIIWHQHKQSPSLSLEVICQNHTAVSLILKNISTEAERNETNFSSSRAKYLLIESKYKEFPHKPSYLASAMFQTL